ncbi:MAG: helix-turn-helix transcriptional regulator [Oscillospiraceae bacterium]
MNIEVANRLVQLRKQNNLSQEELAQKLDISADVVSMWERAESSPDTDNLISLSKLFGVSLDELLNVNQPASTTQVPSAHIPIPYQEPIRYNSNRSNILLAIPYPIICTIIFLLLGFFIDAWHPAWIIFLTIPIYYCVVEAITKNNSQ